MKEENLKQLKMALTDRKNLIVDFGNGLFEELYFDENINAYRGKDVGIWTLKSLVEIAKGEVKDITLKEKLIQEEK